MVGGGNVKQSVNTLRAVKLFNSNRVHNIFNILLPGRPKFVIAVIGKQYNCSLKTGKRRSKQRCFAGRLTNQLYGGLVEGLASGCWTGGFRTTFFNQ